MAKRTADDQPFLTHYEDGNDDESLFNKGAAQAYANLTPHLKEYIMGLEFRPLTKSEITSEFFPAKLPGEAKCPEEFMSAFLEHDQPNIWWLIRPGATVIENDYLGAVNMVNLPQTLFGKTTWYIALRCSFVPKFQNDSLTSGKLLWMFILRYIYIQQIKDNLL